MGLFDKLDKDEEGNIGDMLSGMPDEIRREFDKKGINLKNIKNAEDLRNRLNEVFGEGNVKMNGNTIAVSQTRFESKFDDDHAKNVAAEIASEMRVMIAENDKRWEQTIEYIAQAAKVKPICFDSNGDELKVGDILVIPKNQNIKKVLAIGYHYVRLSHTSDLTLDDGIWFEKGLKEVGAVIKKDAHE